MRLVHLDPADRLPRHVLLPAAVAVVWLLTLAALRVAGPVPSGATTCVFRSVTGVPCPTCGTGRAVRAIGEGRLLDALALNPVTVVAGLGLAGVVALRLGVGRRVSLELGPRGRALLWTAAGALAAANWIWVLVREAHQGS